MKREIKFRAWGNDKMWYPETKTNDNCFTTLHFFNGGGIDWGLYDSIFENRIVSGEYGAIMQFTGLKDKNDKEIYEGDIVQLSDNWLFKDKELCVIEYHQYGIPYIIQRYLKNKPNQGDYNFDYLKDSSISGCEPFYEVIGNIYENPEIINP